MKFSYSLNKMSPFLFLLYLFPAVAFANAIEYEKLLNNIIRQQPEQLVLKGIEELLSSNQTLSDSWISGDVNLIVHHENDALTDNEKYQNWQVGVEFPLWLPSQKNAQKQIAEKYSQELLAQKNYLQWLASKRLRTLVWNHRIAAIEVESAQSSLQKNRSLMRKIDIKVNAGESPRIDLLLAKKQVLNQQNQLLSKQNQLNIAQHQFQQWTQSAIPPSSITEIIQPQRALVDHPKTAMLISILHLSQANLNKTASFKQQSPRLYIGGQNDKNRSDNTTSVVLEMSIPLGIDPSYSPKIAQQRRNVYEKQVVLDKAKIQIERGIFTAQQNLTTAQQSIGLSKQQFDISQQALQMSEIAYNLGETNIQNLLLVQQQTTAAKLNYKLIQARYAQAIATLNQVTGHIIGVQR